MEGLFSLALDVRTYYLIYASITYGLDVADVFNLQIVCNEAQSLCGSLKRT